jgi:hypothetical protein
MLPDPSADVSRGVEQAMGIAQLKMQGDQVKQQGEANTLSLAEKQRAAEQTKLLQADLALASKNPTPSMLASMMTKYPQLSEQFKRTYDVLNTEQQKSRLGQATQVYAALQSGNPEMAQKLLSEQSEAYTNSGMEQEAKTANVLAEMVKLNPAVALTTGGLFLAHAMGPDKFTESFSSLQNEQRNAAKAPAELSEAQSKASKAAVDSKYAESNAVKELEKKGWDITKIQEDIKIAKENARIAAATAGLSRTGNDLKRQELGLKIDEMKLKRDETVRSRVSELTTMHAGIDNALNTIDQVLKSPELDNVLGSVQGSDYYPHTAASLVNPFSDSDERANALALIETVQSQSFLNNLMEAKAKGATFGALTEKEGAKLEGYVTNLRRKQSPKQFKANMKEAQRLLLKSRTTSSKMYGVPSTIPDTPAAAGSSSVDDLVKKYSGQPKAGKK